MATLQADNGRNVVLESVERRIGFGKTFESPRYR